jgi:sugar lactone lactonase YvrE
MQSNLQILSDHICVLGEGPVWDAENNRILWLDIIPGEIHQYNINQNTHKIYKLGEMIGAVALRENSGLIGALQNGFAFIDLDEELMQHILNPEEGLPNRFNDGKCDAAGRFWAGTMAITEEANKGNLYVLETNLSVKKKIENVSISNGIAWNADSSIMYYIDTPTNYVFAFDYNLEEGSITNQKVVVDLTHEVGYADGMTMDEEGMLWIAFFGGWRVGRYDPHTGKFLQQIDLPVSNVTSCTFGGGDLNDLYITTASKGLSEEDLQKQPDAGKLFVVEQCGFTGNVTQKFKG